MRYCLYYPYPNHYVNNYLKKYVKKHHMKCCIKSLRPHLRVELFANTSCSQMLMGLYNDLRQRNFNKTYIG